MPTTRDVTGALCLGGVRLIDLVATSEISTPSYVYDLDVIDRQGGTVHVKATGVEVAPSLTVTVTL